MYVLSRDFGISYHEAYYVRPRWEIKRLLACHAQALAGVAPMDGLDDEIGDPEPTGRLTMSGEVD